MLYRIPTLELKQGNLGRRYSYTVIVMQYYPRFLAKAQVDEYLRVLAPEKPLFTEFKKWDRELKNHDLAFERVEYEKRFSLSCAGFEELKRVSELAAARDVFLVCQCRAVERCHADLLLLVARHFFSADTQTVRHKYPQFLARLENGGDLSERHVGLGGISPRQLH